MKVVVRNLKMGKRDEESIFAWKHDFDLPCKSYGQKYHFIEEVWVANFFLDFFFMNLKLSF